MRKSDLVKSNLLLICYLVCLPNIFSAAPFQLSNTHPNHPDFERNLLGYYGVNSNIEPEITSKDKPTYEKVIPHLQTDPKLAIDILKERNTAESSAAFDYLLAMLYYQMDDFINTNTWLDKALKKFPNFRRAIRLKAVIHIRQDNYKGCIQEFLKVVKLGGGDSQCFGLLAYSYLNLENYTSALEAYQIATMFNPSSKDFKMGMAQCYQQLNEFKKAIGYYDELIQIMPNNKNLWMAQANAFLAEDRYDDAIANLEIVKSMGLADFQSLTLLSQLHFNNGIETLSSSALNEALTKLNTEEDSKEILKILDLYLNHGWFQAIESILNSVSQQMISNLPESEKISWKLARAHFDLNTDRIPQAYQQLKSILSRDPMHGMALMLLGEYYKNQNQLEEAIFQYERAALLEDHQYKAYLALAQLHVQKGDFESALKVLYKAQQIKSSKNLLDYIQQVEKAYRSTYNGL